MCELIKCSMASHLSQTESGRENKVEEKGWTQSEEKGLSKSKAGLAGFLGLLAVLLMRAREV